MADVALIGLGLLGSAIAERLLAAGRSVIGFDLDPARRSALQQAGGGAVPSAGEAFGGAPVVILSLPDSHIVERVTSGFPAATGAKLVIDRSQLERVA